MMTGPRFQDRAEAGRKLAGLLDDLKDERPVILALPRGGVPVAAEIARALNAPLDVLLVCKIGLPGQPELAYAAVVDGAHPELVLNEDIAGLAEVPEDYLAGERARCLEEIGRRRRLYLGGRPPAEIAGRTAIVVDDGIATGTTVRAALRAVRRLRPRRLVLAVPVGPPDSIAALRAEADEVVCPVIPTYLRAVGLFYEDFHQVSDQEVIALLA